MRRAVLALTMIFALAAPAPAGTFCTCRANGQNYREGQILCIRGKLSRCEMNQNVTSWKVLAGTCPEARHPDFQNFGAAPDAAEKVLARRLISRLSPG